LVLADDTIKAAIEDDRWIGFTAYLPPCIEGVWEEGAIEETGRTCRLIALYFKGIIDELFEGEGTAETPFASWLEDEIGGGTENLQRFLDWNDRCKKPLSKKEIIGIVYRVIDSPRTCPTCKELQAVAGTGIYCVEEDCRRAKKAPKVPGTEPEPEEKTPEEIRTTAEKILREGTPLDLIVDSCDRFVLGSKNAIKKLICCEMVQFVPSSQGLHPKLSGESGTGKTKAVKVFLHHLPEDAYIAGGLTPKALAYHNLGDKLFVFLDDYKPNEDLDTIIKQTSSDFHRPYIHRTVKKQEAAELPIGSEMTWCVTSVDASQDIQVLNRQIPLNTDDSDELTAKVNDFTIDLYGEGSPELYEDDMVILCREVFRQLRALGEIKVRVPFADRIEWLDNTNRRNPSIFMDILVGITAFHCFQRDRDDDGFYLSTEDDFNCAKALFAEGDDAEELIKRLTKKERQFAEALIEAQKAGHDGLTRAQVAKALKVTGARVSQIARGDKGTGGLMQKLTGFEVIEATVRKSEDVTERVQLYRLDGFNRFAGFDAVVRLSKMPVRSKPNSKIDKGLSNSSSSKYSKYIVRYSPLTTENESLTFSPKKPNSPNSDSGRPVFDLTSAKGKPNDLTQAVSEAARKGLIIKTSDFVGVSELDVLEELVRQDFDERKGGYWHPPSRM